MKRLFLITSLFSSFLIIAQTSRIEKWTEDINFYQSKIEENHIDLYHTITKDTFSKDIKTLKSRVSKLTDFQIIVELMRITHKIGAGKSDGHTSVPLWGMELYKFPITLFDFGNEIRVIKTTKKYQHLLGKRLIRINDVPVEVVYKRVSKLTPFTENKQSLMDRTCQYMMISELLFALEVIKEENTALFTFIDDKNIEEQVTVNSFSKKRIDSFEYKELSISHPKIVKPQNALFEKLWFTSLNSAKTIYINFKHYPSENEMNTFSENIYNFINENKSENLVIDIRDNYGGDFFIGQILASWLNALDSIKWKTNVYVLVNRKTYSAAMVNAVQFKQLLNAKIVGEPTGANPNGYQDMGTFNLPNSNLMITYTKRLFRLQDKNSAGLQPNILITPKWLNYKKGIDEALNWVLKDIKKLN